MATSCSRRSPAGARTSTKRSCAPTPGSAPLLLATQATDGVIIVGLMSGTSVDGIDVAVVDVTNVDDTLQLRLLGYVESPIDDSLRERIHALFSPDRSRIDEVCEVNVLLGEAFASAAALAIRQAGVEPDLIASHG